MKNRYSTSETLFHPSYQLHSSIYTACLVVLDISQCRISEPISLWKTFYLDRPKISAVAFNSVRFFQVVFPFKFLVYSCHRKRWSAYKKVGFPWPHVTWVTRSFELFSHSQFTQPQINRPDLSVWDKPPFHKLTLPSAFTII